MSSNISNPSSLSKLGALLFARQTPCTTAPRHKSLREALQGLARPPRAENELYSLSDRDLADIGLCPPGHSRRRARAELVIQLKNFRTAPGDAPGALDKRAPSS